MELYKELAAVLHMMIWCSSPDQKAPLYGR